MSETVQAACPACLTTNRVLAVRLDENPTCGRCAAPLFPGAPVELTEATFDKFVSRTSLPVLADFWTPANW